MDSLLANYASSDEDEEAGFLINQPTSSAKLGQISSLSSSLPAPTKSSSILSSLLPPDKSSSFSILSSLPPPKSSSSSSSSNLLSLPPPKSHQSNISKLENSDANAKKVFQFRPPLNPFPSNLDDDDDDDGEEEERKKKAKIAFSSSSDGNSLGSKPFVLPPPKHSFFLAPPPSSSARRIVVEADVPSTASKTSNEVTGGQETCNGALGNQNFDNYEQSSVDGASYPSSNQVPGNQYYGNYGNYESCAPYVQASHTTSWGSANDNYSSCENYGYHQGFYGDGSMATTSVPSIQSVRPLMGNSGKRGKNEVPADIVEVKQEDLISNRPREDQVKLTGIAFGPAYQMRSSLVPPSCLRLLGLQRVLPNSRKSM
ncbi:uncharacterized serine-rich protein C215.13-like isoform X2 [Aristolochia californica]|uniref:uncharacterized serine-rich protein C215.13-like isoform X2 n=1 Tax=Aristolochia californica TaxID=171875 RepID=UPI0035D7275D